MTYEVTHYKGRHFAVYAGAELLAVTVYRKGAERIAAELRQRDERIQQSDREASDGRGQ